MQFKIPRDTNEIQNGRRSGGYKPTLWDFNSIQSFEFEPKVTKYTIDSHDFLYNSTSSYAKLQMHVAREAHRKGGYSDWAGEEVVAAGATSRADRWPT